MTDEEEAALRRRARDWQAKVSTAPAHLLALYDNLIEASLAVTTRASDVPAAECMAE